MTTENMHHFAFATFELNSEAEIFQELFDDGWAEADCSAWNITPEERIQGLNNALDMIHAIEQTFESD